MNLFTYLNLPGTPYYDVKYGGIHLGKIEKRGKNQWIPVRRSDQSVFGSRYQAAMYLKATYEPKTVTIA